MMPYEPLTEAQVKQQRKLNAEVEGRKWSDKKKAHYKLLRERLPLCEQYMGKTVAYEYDKSRDGGLHTFAKGSGIGVVQDVKIEDGGIVYILDTKPQGIRRSWLVSWEIVEDAT